jgi:hypothetical protein
MPVLSEAPATRLLDRWHQRPHLRPSYTIEQSIKKTAEKQKEIPAFDTRSQELERILREIKAAGPITCFYGSPLIVCVTTLTRKRIR